MNISTFDLFSIGIGPSSSHTVGPMRAANRFVKELAKHCDLAPVQQLRVTLFGSLAWTGTGHGTPGAVLMGLEGECPETIDPTTMEARVQAIQSQQQLTLAGTQPITFDFDTQFILDKKNLLPAHSNGMRFQALDQNGNSLFLAEYYSVGGGFVMAAEELEGNAPATQSSSQVPYPFHTAKELLDAANGNQKTIAEIMFANECTWRSEEAIRTGILAIWQVMHSSIKNGCHNEGMLPGRLQVKRRAPGIYSKLMQVKDEGELQAVDMNWLSVYAIAVNEENAAGGRVVTAPTNGAAGIIPSVLQFYLDTKPSDEKIIEFLLTASAIGILYKENASISAAEVGCQGEVGVACSMAAAAFAAVSGASPSQIENAAEIAMEHHLGLTCDPIAGLVQIPCIERNAMGSVQAVNAARLAMLGDGEHKVSLDEVIETMRVTGRDMLTKYKETSQGGLAVNVPEC